MDPEQTQAFFIIILYIVNTKNQKTNLPYLSLSRSHTHTHIHTREENGRGGVTAEFRPSRSVISRHVCFSFITLDHHYYLVKSLVYVLSVPLLLSPPPLLSVSVCINSPMVSAVVDAQQLFPPSPCPCPSPFPFSLSFLILSQNQKKTPIDNNSNKSQNPIGLEPIQVERREKTKYYIHRLLKMEKGRKQMKWMKWMSSPLDLVFFFFLACLLAFSNRTNSTHPKTSSFCYSMTSLWNVQY